MADLTKKELKAYIQELEEKLQGVERENDWQCFAESPVPTFVADQDGKFVALNHALEQFGGYGHDEVPDIETALDLVIPDKTLRKKLLKKIVKTRAKKQNFTQFRLFIVTKNGEEKYVEFSTFFNSDGSMRIVQCVDVSDMKRAENALLKSNERHRSFMENFQGVAFQVDFRSGVPVYLYGTVEEMTGYAPEDFLSGDVFWESLIYKDDYAKVIIELDRMRRDLSRNTNIEFRYITRTNEVRWARILSNVVCDEQGLPQYLYGSAFDITEFKNATEQSLLHQQQLIQAGKMASLGILVSGVAHEINNPNHYILSNINMLKNVWTDIEPIIEKYYREHGDFSLGNMPYSEMSEHIPLLFSAIREGSERIKLIVKELRDYSRQTSVEMNDRVNVNNVVQSSVILLSNMIEKSTHKFIRNLDDTLPVIMGNYRRLEQVVINLIQNACQALDDKREAIEVSTTMNQEKTHVMIIVRDEGVGIHDEKLQYITDPFFTTKRESKGTGLGLSIALRIIRDHGGTIGFQSAEGRGTTATISLPVGNIYKSDMNTSI